MTAVAGESEQGNYGELGSGVPAGAEGAVNLLVRARHAVPVVGADRSRKRRCGVEPEEDVGASASLPSKSTHKRKPTSGLIVRASQQEQAQPRPLPPAAALTSVASCCHFSSLYFHYAN
jgi:hypothetical protein